MKTIIFVFVVVMFAIGGTSVSRQPIGLSVVDLKIETLHELWHYGKIQWGGSLISNTDISGDWSWNDGGTYTITLPSTSTSPGK